MPRCGGGLPASECDAACGHSLQQLAVKYKHDPAFLCGDARLHIWLLHVWPLQPWLSTACCAGAAA